MIMNGERIAANVREHVTDATRDHQHSKFKEVATVKKEKKEKKEEENIVTYTVPVFVLREESG
jgi:hypothetical protein